MRQHAVLFLTVVATSVVFACSDDSGGARMQAAVGGGAAGLGGTAGMGGAAGIGGSAGGASGGAPAIPPVPPDPALPPNAATVACPLQINGSLDSSDRTQTGRHSRIAPVAACGTAKGFPGNAADPTNPHLYDVYRFANPGAAAVCFNFALTYGASGAVEAGLDAGPDAAVADAGAQSSPDAGDAGDAGAGTPGVNAGPARYLTAYSTFYPTDLSLAYLGDVGDSLSSPQAMGITVPAGGTIDVVVYAIDPAPAGVGPYTLSCSTQ